MTKLKQVYKCNICGNIVELLHAGAGELVCCGQPMELLVAKTKDEGKEKHMPIIVKTGSEIIIKVGSMPHPMETDHYIEWIEIISDEGVCRQYLKPGQEPQAKFCPKTDSVQARIYCNIHGLWKSE